MRVLHVITGLAAGGAEQQLRLLLRHQRGVAEVAALTNPGRVAQAIRAEGTTVHEIGMRGSADVAALPRLVALIRAGGYDVVHTHLYRACVHGRAAARLAGVRGVVATEHSLGEHQIEGRRLTPAVRALYLASERLGRATIAVSPTVASRLVAWGVPAERVFVIPNGVDAAELRFDPRRRERARARLGLPADRFTVGAVGRLVAGKRFDLVLRAMRGVPSATALIVGAGPLLRPLRRLATDLGVEAVLPGERGDLPDLLAAMDILVAASTEETFGLAVVEALAAGLPVLYTACPAVEDLPAGSVPGACRVPAEVDALAAALTAHRGRPARLSPPPALARYHIGPLAARVHDLYAAITHQQRSRSWSSR